MRAAAGAPGAVCSCVNIKSTRKLVVASARNQFEFEFDWVLPESSTQTDVFDGQCGPKEGSDMHEYILRQLLQ